MDHYHNEKIINVVPLTVRYMLTKLWLP